MQLLIEENQKRSVASLFDARLGRLGDFIAGETVPLYVARLKEIAFPFDSRLFAPQAISDYTIQVALGGGFDLPVAGRYKITFTAADLSTETTDWLNHDADAEEVSEALNILTKVIAAGGVAVSGGEGIFEIRFNTVGVRNILSGDATELTPLSLLSFSEVTAGTASVREIQVLRIRQNAGAVATLATDSASGSIAIAVTAGTGSTNTTARITISDDVYDGKWRFKKDANTSAWMGIDDNAAQIKAAIEATTGIGSGNADVTQESDGTWFVEFIGSLANTSVTVLTVASSNLRAIPFKSGTLDLRTVGTDMLLNGSAEKVVSLEITATPSGGTPWKTQRSITLRRAILEPAMTQPQSLNLEAYSGVSADVTVSTTGTTDLAPPNRFFQWFQRVIAEAGAGAYTRKLTLDNSNALEGAVFRVAVELAASANPTIQIFDDLISGTQIGLAVNPDPTIAAYYQGEFVFKSGHWEKMEEKFI